MGSPVRRLARAAALGLTISLLVASISLAVAALMRTRATCETPGTEQCVFENSLNAELARLQALEAAGCACVGIGLGLWLRARRDDDASP